MNREELTNLVSDILYYELDIDDGHEQALKEIVELAERYSDANIVRHLNNVR